MRAFLNFIENNNNPNKIIKQNLNNWGGTIPLPGFGLKSKKDTESDSKRIDSVFKKTSLFEQQLAYIPLSVSQPNSKQQSLPTYSIYVLLGAIAELIRYYKGANGNLDKKDGNENLDKKDGNENSDKKDANENLDKGLSQLSQVRSYPMPNFVNSTIGELDLRIYLLLECQKKVKTN